MRRKYYTLTLVFLILLSYAGFTHTACWQDFGWQQCLPSRNAADWAYFAALLTPIVAFFAWQGLQEQIKKSDLQFKISHYYERRNAFIEEFIKLDEQEIFGTKTAYHIQRLIFGSPPCDLNRPDLTLKAALPNSVHSVKAKIEGIMQKLTNNGLNGGLFISLQQLNDVYKLMNQKLPLFAQLASERDRDAMKFFLNLQLSVAYKANDLFPLGEHSEHVLAEITESEAIMLSFEISKKQHF